MKTKRVGLIGLGEMGLGMARNLLAAGFPLTGHDLRAERMALLQALGGAAADNAAQLGRASDVVIVMVFDGQQLLALLQAEDGLLAGMRPGRTVIICSTIGPDAMRTVAERLADSGLRWLDCPVSGGRAVAGAGALGLFAAGTAADMAAQRDVLAALGERIIHVGEEAGLGQALKAATLAFYAVSTVGLLEALTLARSAGVPDEALGEVFGGGADSSKRPTSTTLPNLYWRAGLKAQTTRLPTRSRTSNFAWPRTRKRDAALHHRRGLRTGQGRLRTLSERRQAERDEDT